MVLSFWTLCIVSGGAALCGASWMHTRQKRRLAKVHTEIDGLKDELVHQKQSLEETSQREEIARRTALKIQYQKDQDDHAQRLAKRESNLANKSSRYLETNERADQQENQLALRSGQLKRDQENLKQLEEQIENLKTKVIQELEARSSSTQKEVSTEYVQERKDKAKWRARRNLTNDRDTREQNATADARQLMGRVMERISVSGHLERIQNTITFTNPKTKDVFADPESPARKILHEHIDFRLEESKTKNSLLVRGDDPLGREIGRRVLRQISNKSISAPNKVRSICKRTNEEIERELKNAARKAFKELGLKNAHPDIMALVGRLKFRLSYSQNQLKHAVEVAYLSGMLAQEMGLDVRLARRAGLLHDIGKAMTHEREGSHAVLGAEVARRCRENESVCNAIGSHHNDEPMETPYAHIVTAADAISGARPGARRETITLYLDRVKQIHEIASRHPEVERVDVMHAGREVRIMVPGRDENPDSDNKKSNMRYVPDEELHPLAEDVARDLEEEMTFPGQIKVTVIRHSNAVATAK